MAVTNADLGISEGNSFADSTPETTAEKKEAKTVRPVSKMQAAASTAVAPPVEPPMPVASAPAPVVLPPTPTASAPAVPPVTNPATTGDFWKGALTSAIPTVLGGLGLTAGGYLAGRGRGVGGGGGGGTATPVVDEEMRQIKLAQEQAKHESIIARNYREQEAHQSKMSLEAKRAEAILQRTQGKSASPTNSDAQATQMLVKSEEAKVSKAVDAATRAKPVNSTPPPAVGPTAVAPAIQPTVAPPQPQMKYGQINMGAPTATPLPNTVQQPAVAPPVQTPPPAPTTTPPPGPVVEKTPKPTKPVVDTSGLSKEEAGMKKYLISQYGGGTHGEQAYEKAVEILGQRPAFAPGEGGGLSPKENETIKAWRKENIEGPKVNLTHDMKKVMKGAGGLAILASIPGFAEAAQRKDFGKMTDIASDFFVLPFAQSTEAGMPKAQEESLISQRFKEAQKLGSPYRSVPPPR
jgi:hypothetical protein